MLASALGVEKERLYLTLNHRGYKPGYHWSLVVSPKDKPYSKEDTSVVPDSDRWHIRNSVHAPDEQHETAGVWWHKECDRVNLYTWANLIARFTLGKFKTSDHDTTVRRITEATDRVPVDQDDPDLTCRTWLMQVINILICDGVIRLNVPDAAALVRRATEEANKVRDMIRAEQIKIDRKSAIPLFDVRAD